MKIIYASGNEQQRKLYTLYLENLLPEAKVYEIYGLSGLKEISEWIKDYQAIFVSDDLNDGNARDILDALKENNTQAKFIFIGDRYPANFPEPEIFDGLNSDFLAPQLSFEAFKSEMERVFARSFSLTDIYRNVPIVGFYRYNKVLCDTYIKLSDNKYVKIQKAGTTYSREDLDKYRFKGIKQLYIKNDDFFKYDVSFTNLSFLERTESFAKLTEEQMLLRLSDVHLQLHDLAKSLGISDQAIAMAEDNTKNLIFFISDHPGLEALFIHKATQEDYLYDHSYFTAIVCAEIFTKLGLNANEGLKKLCQASIMHDITIKNAKIAQARGQNDPKLLDFTKEEVRNYLKHPTLSANLLEATGQFSPDVIEIVRYHHITPEGGFPEKIHPSRLSLLTSVFIIAHEFVSKMYDNNFDKERISKIVLEMVLRYREPNFKKALSAFEEAKDYLAIGELVA